MSSSQHCSECGAEISAGKSNGLCTRCLLALGLKAASVPSPTDQVAPADPSRLTPHASRATAFGDYELIEEIARGGMGIVYKARQVSLDRIVAVKLLIAGALSSPEYVKRFRIEASAAASLQHPSIVTIHEVGVHQGQHYLVMDYVDGPSLAKLVAQQPLSAERAVAYVKTVAEAVHFAHEHGILHRDLKPSNILINANEQPRVTDFGLAKRFEGESEVTLSGQFVGSPSYMPPEQATAKRGKVSRRSDVYGLGATLYHLLTGRAPFQAATLTDTLDQVLNTEPVAPRLLNPAVPRDLETICLNCLEKEPAKRYPTAQMLAEELDRFLNGQPVLARPIGPTGRVWRWCRRQPVQAGLIAALILVFTLGLIGMLWQWQRAERIANTEARQRLRAEVQTRRAEAEGLSARRNAYASDMKEVQRALEETDLGRARELLELHRPRRQSPIQTDVRGWEWRYLWARCRSDERFTLHQYSNAVSALAFSSDGKWLAVRRQGGALALWDAAAKRPATELPGAGLHHALAFSPQTNLLAWGNTNASGKPVVSLWDLSPQKEIAQFPHLGKILSIAFSPDAKQMAALAFDGTVRVWDVESKQFLADFPTALNNSYPGRYSAESATATEPMWSDASDDYGRVLFSPDGRLLVVGEAIPRIRVLERATGKETDIPLLPPADGVTALAFSRDGKWLAAGCGYNEKEVHIWDLANLAAITNVTFAGHSGWIATLAFTPDGQTLASVSTDQTLRLWDVAGKVERRRFQGNTDEVWALAWSPDGQDLVTGARDGTVRYWDPVAKPAPLPYVVLPPIWPWGPAFLPDSKTFLAVTMNEGSVVRLAAHWDTATVAEVEKLSFLGTNHTSLDLSRDGRWLALGEWAGNVQVWDFPARRQITNLVIPNATMVFSSMFSASGHFLNCGAWCLPSNGRLTGKFWDVATWREILLQNLDLNGAADVAYHPDDRTVAIGFVDGTAAWWNLVTGKKQTAFPSMDAFYLRTRFSPDGRLFATASFNGLITVWDVATQRPKPIPRRQGRDFRDLAFSPDGRRLMASGSNPRGVARLWDVEIDREIVTLPGESGYYIHVGFSPDTNTIFAASPPGDGPVLLWCAPSWAEIEAAENGKKGP
jgi:eukaryotic-like serine/threonine-protein kinase